MGCLRASTLGRLQPSTVMKGARSIQRDLWRQDVDMELPFRRKIAWWCCRQHSKLLTS